MNVVIGASNQVHIPTVGPFEFGLIPLHIVRENDWKFILTSRGLEGQECGWVIANGVSAFSIARGNFRMRKSSLRDIMGHTDRMDIKSGNVHATSAILQFKVSNDELQVIIEIVFEFGVIERSILETNGIPTNGIVVLRTSHENRETIKCKMNTVLLLD